MLLSLSNSKFYPKMYCQYVVRSMYCIIQEWFTIKLCHLFIKADCNYPGVPVAIKLSSAFLARFKQLPAFLFGFCKSSAKKISIHILIRNTYLIYTVYLTLSTLAHKLPSSCFRLSILQEFLFGILRILCTGKHLEWITRSKKERPTCMYTTHFRAVHYTESHIVRSN